MGNGYGKQLLVVLAPKAVFPCDGDFRTRKFPGLDQFRYQLRVLREVRQCKEELLLRGRN